MDKITELIEIGIGSLIPIYDGDMGNATKIVTADGQIYIEDKVLKTVLRILCKYYTVHIESCREKYGRMLHRRLGVPLPIHSRLLLVPFKMRKPMFNKDGAYGYVNLYDIDRIEEKRGQGVISLQSGVDIPCLHKVHTMQQHINQARLVAGNIPLYQRVEAVKEDGEDFYEVSQRPATKADIAILKNEIVELRRVLKRGTMTMKKET
ncbi:MAG: hypothetical protein AB2421_11480 [Thermotaleaceae bacterium]